MLYFTRILPDPSYTNTALSKADKDFAFFMKELSGKELELSPADDLDLKFSALTAGDIVIYQHPTFRGISFEFQILAAIRRKGAAIITFVHDSLVIRNEEVPRNNAEVKLFNQSDQLIVHTEAMKERLKSYGVHCQMVVQGFFGYQIREQIGFSHESEDFRRLIYAGNLWKSLFMLDYDSQTPLEIYGKWPENWTDSAEILSHSICYHGEVAETALPFSHFTGFGLAWDGWNVPDMSLEGRYTKYNCSLKVSNYLAYGLPVIVWSGNALASTIKKEGLGLLLDDLKDVDAVLNSLRVKDYKDLVAQVSYFSPKIQEGGHTKNAVLTAVARCKNEEEEHFKSL